MAWKAARKPSRGGIANLICIAEPLDVLAAELGCVADRLSVIFPWGSLLRAIAAPETGALVQIASLCLSGATIEIVFSYDPQRDSRAGLSMVQVDERHISLTLPKIYQQASLHITSIERLPQRELINLGTTWATRLAYGHLRDVWHIRATR